MNIKQFLVLFFISIFIINCGGDKEPTFNKSASFWYSQMNTKIDHGDLDGATEDYSSLLSEHIASKLLPRATLILASAHSEKEEYIMARFYYNEYIQKFASSKDIDYIKYLKLKMKVQSISHVDKSQLLLQNAITEAKNFLVVYPKSKYIPLVNTIIAKLIITQNLQNKHIKDLYTKLGNIEAAKIYQEKISNSNIESIKYKIPKTPWYKVAFE